MRTIIRVAGTRQLHIALCPTMAARLAELYDSRVRIEIISNLAFFDPLDAVAPRKIQRLDVIGYLSNISFEKGIDRFLDLMAQLRAKGSEIVGRIAGPFVNNKVKQYVEWRIGEIDGLEYVGPVYGAEKISFFSSIDLLVFPTRYLNEAEPLVIYEAQAAGVVVAASDRGCLANMIPAELLFDPTGSNLDRLIEQILIWESDPTILCSVARRTRHEFAKLLKQQRTDAIRFRALVSAYDSSYDRPSE
jgi:glycosyltransferase involved in cell wall biosynthesis